MRKTAALTILSLLILPAFPAAATEHASSTEQTNRFLGDRWNFRLLANLTELTSDVSAGRELGALINLEELLGFDDRKGTWGFDGFYRFTKNRRHTIRIAYVDFTRDAFTELSGTVPIFDVDFLGEVTSRFGNQVGTVT